MWPQRKPKLCSACGQPRSKMMPVSRGAPKGAPRVCVDCGIDNLIAEDKARLAAEQARITAELRPPRESIAEDAPLQSSVEWEEPPPAALLL